MSAHRLCLLALLLGLPGCGHLSQPECDAVYAAWNRNVDGLAQYEKNIKDLQQSLENYTIPRPPALAVANVWGASIDGINAPPAMDSKDFDNFPKVRQALIDLQTDMESFKEKLADHKLVDGKTGLWLKTDDGDYPVALDQTDGLRGHALWLDQFGKPQQRINDDYRKALDAMQSSYPWACSVDRSEVRTVEDF